MVIKQANGSKRLIIGIFVHGTLPYKEMLTHMQLEDHSVNIEKKQFIIMISTQNILEDAGVGRREGRKILHLMKIFRDGAIAFRCNQFLLHLFQSFCYCLHFLCQRFQLYLHKKQDPKSNRFLSFLLIIIIEFNTKKYVDLRRSFQATKVQMKIKK